MDDNREADTDAASTLGGPAEYCWLADGLPHWLNRVYWEQEHQASETTAMDAPTVDETPVTPEAAEPRSIPVKIAAHIALVGDTDPKPDGWAGVPESGHSIEGFTLEADVPAGSVTYQVTWAGSELSDRVPLGSFCGTRGQSKPVRGFVIHVDETLATPLSVAGEAFFVDGSYINRIQAGTPCEARSGAALEAVRLIFVEGAPP